MKTFVRVTLLGVLGFVLSCKDDNPPSSLPRVSFLSPVEFIGSENVSLAVGVQNGRVLLPDQPLDPRRSDARGDYYGMRLALDVPPPSQLPENAVLYLERNVYADPDQRKPLEVDRIPIRKGDLPPNGGRFLVEVRKWVFPANATYTTLNLMMLNPKNILINRLVISYCVPCSVASFCRMQNGKFRPYKCEFLFQQLTALKPDGTPMSTWQMSTDTLKLAKSQAISSEPAGPSGTVYTFSMRATLKRKVPPVFPPKVGYNLGYSWLTAPLNTPNPDGTLAEYKYLTTGVPLTMAVGGTADVNFNLPVVFTGGSAVQPPAFFAVENDSTTTKFSGTQLMGNKAEAYVIPKIKFVP